MTDSASPESLRDAAIAYMKVWGPSDKGLEGPEWHALRAALQRADAAPEGLRAELAALEDAEAADKTEWFEQIAAMVDRAATQRGRRNAIRMIRAALAAAPSEPPALDARVGDAIAGTIDGSGMYVRGYLARASESPSEPPALDVERVATAFCHKYLGPDAEPNDADREWARDFIAAYEAASAPKGEPT